jgi:hypothetical protein
MGWFGNGGVERQLSSFNFRLGSEKKISIEKLKINE